MPHQLLLAIKCIPALFTFVCVWFQSSDLTSMLIATFVSFVTVATVVVQSLLIAVVSFAITAVMQTCMYDIPYVSDVIFECAEKSITLATVAMFCGSLMLVQLCRIRKSFSTLLALLMLVPLMLAGCNIVRKSVVTLRAAVSGGAVTTSMKL